MMSIDSQTKQAVGLYDMVNDPSELRNLVKDPSLENVRHELLDGHLSHLLGHLDDARLRVFRESGH